MKLAIVLLTLACSPTASSPTIEAVWSFPGTVNQALSPNGRLAVVNEDRDQEPNHVLFLRNTETNLASAIFPYRRHVDVSWASDSRFFFVNDYAESNSSDCIVIDTGSMARKHMSRALRSERHRTLRLDESHLYVTCSTWRAQDLILVSVVGHDGSVPGGIKERFIFDARTGRLLRQRGPTAAARTGSAP